MKTYRLTALWDDEAKVWATAETEIPGLVVEAESFEAFVAMAEDLAPELVADNLPEASGPFALRVEGAAETAFNIFGSDLPDEAFADVFDQERTRKWREIEL